MSYLSVRKQGHDKKLRKDVMAFSACLAYIVQEHLVGVPDT